MKNTLFVLGTKDPEMEKIEKLINLLGYNYTYNYDNNYSGTVICIEYHHPIEDSICLDHHSSCDVGFHLDYNDFLEASSLGQFIEYILINDTERVIEALNLKIKYKNKKNGYFFNKKWFYGLNSISIQIPKRIVYIAAIDHCLKDVYLNKCKGIKTTNLFDKRIYHISENLNINYDFVFMRTFYLYNKYFSQNITKKILDLRKIKFNSCNYPLDYLLLREIALYLNQPIALELTNSQCKKKKIMFLSLSHKQSLKILKKKKFKKKKFKEVFGVPNRSYVGGIF